MHTVEGKTWDEFWAHLWQIDYRHAIPHIPEWDKKLVEFIEHVCRLKPGMKILDLACGSGDQARHFARKGYHVVGLDIASTLIRYAKNRFKDENLAGELFSDDMRNIDFMDEFDSCLILGGSFGYFDYGGDLELLKKIHRGLKPGGRLFLVFRTIDRLYGKTRIWSETDQGWLLCEERYSENDRVSYLDWFLVTKDNTMLRMKRECGRSADCVIRCYSPAEMTAMFTEAGFVSLKSYGGNDFSIPPRELPPERLRNIIVGVKP